MNIRRHPDVVQFQQAAGHYCRLLESKPADPHRWIKDILSAVAQLYACGHALPTFDISDAAPDIDELFRVDDDEWERVFKLVHDTLAALDVWSGYWTYSDPSEPPDSDQDPVVGDLGDDLADIYRDIKPGLRAWETGVRSYLPGIVFEWKDPMFGSHWGVHAVNAMRALHALAFRYNGESGRDGDA